MSCISRSESNLSASCLQTASPGLCSLVLSRDCHLGTAPLKLVSHRLQASGQLLGDLPGGYWGHGLVLPDGPKVCSPTTPRNRAGWSLGCQGMVAPVTPVHPPTLSLSCLFGPQLHPELRTGHLVSRCSIKACRIGTWPLVGFN